MVEGEEAEVVLLVERNCDNVSHIAINPSIIIIIIIIIKLINIGKKYNNIIIFMVATNYSEQ